MRLREITDALIHLVYPHVCAGCHSDLLTTKAILCLKCLQALPETNFHPFPGNPVERMFYGRMSLQSATAHFYFTKESLMQILMHEIKYKGFRELAVYLGQLMGEQMAASERYTSVDAMVPLPLFKSREKQRGYNQSALICQGLSAALQIPVLNTAVARNQYTESQTKKGRVERWQNMEGKFEITDHSILQGKHILLVDDVITTGATIEACGNTIIEEAKMLSIASLCFAAR